MTNRLSDARQKFEELGLEILDGEQLVHRRSASGWQPPTIIRPAVIFAPADEQLLELGR